MFTYTKMSAEEFSQKLTGGQHFSIVVPNDNFEISLLNKVLIDELHLMFEGEDDEYDKFDALCSYIWYDGYGRFFFDLSEDPQYTPDKLSFYISVFNLDELDELDEMLEMIRYEEMKEIDLVHYKNDQDELDELDEGPTNCDYEFYAYSHYEGIMNIDLNDAIRLMMSNHIQKNMR